MNSAAALVAGNKARDLKEGVGVASRSIDSGAARGKLEALIALSHRLAASSAIDDATIQLETRHAGASRAPAFFTAAI
jgi:hypothetical protein